MRTVDESQNGQTIELAVGEEIEVRLPETASTGFRWQVASSAEPACTTLGETSEPPASAKPGSPGAHRWHLQAKKAGECELKLAYRRPWETSGDAVREFRIRLRVAPQ